MITVYSSQHNPLVIKWNGYREFRIYRSGLPVGGYTERHKVATISDAARIARQWVIDNEWSPA